MKKLIILGALLLPSLIASCGIDPSVPTNLSAQDVDAEIRTATLDQLVERQDLYYEINSETPFTGLLRDVYPNGQKKREGNFVRGVLDGGMTAWYENGQKKYKGNFVNGGADGLVTNWYDNGQMKTAINWVNTELDGLQTKWHDNGQKKSEEIWVGGASQGKRCWDYDGNELSGDC